MIKGLKIVSVIFCVFISNFISGQSNLNISKYSKLTPPSPNASALTRFAGAGVSLNTGMVTYSVPIYDFKFRKLNLPVSLHYASNGVKVNEAPSFTGMGWTLEAGGVITRQKNGSADGSGGARIELDENINTCSTEFYNFVNNNSDPLYFGDDDSEPDIFTYNFAGYSGKFILDKFNNAFFLPKSNLKVEVNLSGTIYAFKITTPDGLKYYFGGNNASEETFPNSATAVCIYGAGGNEVPVITGFYLNKIESPEGDVMTFTYDINCYRHKPVYIIEICNHPISETYFCPSTACPDERETYYHHAFYRLRLLREINVAGTGKIQFNYTGYNTEGTGGQTETGYNALTNIKVLDNEQRQIKNVNLTYSYVTTTIGSGPYPTVIPPASVRPFLTGVTDGDKVYTLEYDNPQGLPVFGSLRQDFWGFYNGQNNVNFIPNIGISLVHCPEATANRNAFPSYAQYGMLKKITEPTRGYDSIIYEGNTTANGLIGGVRVQKVYTYDGVSSTPMIKRYHYAPMNDLGNQTISGSAVIPIVTENETAGFICSPSILTTCDYEVTTSLPINDLNIYGGNIVSYRYVTESFGGDNFENGGIEHEFTVQNYNYSYPVMNGDIYNGPVNFDAVLNGKEVKTRIYKKPPVGTLILTEQQENFFSIDLSSVNDKIVSWRSHQRWFDGAQYCTYPGIDLIKTYYYRFWPHLDSTITTQFDENGLNPIIIKDKFFYENLQHLQVTRTERYDSKGALVQVFSKYPNEFSSPGNVYEKMVNLNMVEPVIEEKAIRNSQQTILKTNYLDWFNDNRVLAPVNIETQKQGYSQESRVRYFAYDYFGNPLKVSKENDSRTAFIWDYNNSLLIAEVNNAYDSIAYTSFEADGKGNWSFSGVSVLDASAPTGKKAYNLNGSNNITKSINSGVSYIISYWTKNASAFTIPGTQPGYPVSGRIVNGWKYFEHKITGQSLATISGSGFIDELRLYPANALMTTLTYLPMVGTSSQCNPNNDITYYEYDTYGRLILIRDQGKNIIKKICYNYSGQTENCSVFYNVLKSGNFTRNNCGAGYTGSTVTYTVPAEIYNASTQTEADAKAQADVDANGQAYANAAGTCTASNVTLTSLNTTGASGFTARYTNNSTGLQYTFNISSTGGLQTLGSVPPGTYTVYISKPGNNVRWVFSVYSDSFCDMSSLYATSATFYNIVVSTSISCNGVQMDPL